MRRHLILNSKPCLRGWRPSDETVRLELPQLLPKYFGGNPIHRPAKFAKAERPSAQALENHWLPSSF